MVKTCAADVALRLVAGKVMLAGENVKVAAPDVPVPARETSCGEPEALSAIESDAVREPADAGLNSIETVQLAPAASEAEQVVADLRNELALVPVMVSEDRFTAVVPVFFTVTTCAAEAKPTAVEAKVRLAGETLTDSGEVPVPESETGWGEPVALSATERLAVSAPAAAGLNSTETVQLALTASEAPQVVADLTKELALMPVMVSEASDTAAVPVFLMVTTCAAVVDPKGVEAKARLVGLKVTVWVGAVLGHALTRLVILTEPKPMAGSYPTVAG